jgi:hypothetical protein
MLDSFPGLSNSQMSCSMLDAELSILFHPDFNAVIIPDSGGRQQIHDCSSNGCLERGGLGVHAISGSEIDTQRSRPMQCVVGM